MNKLFFFIVLSMFINSSCKKQELDASNQMIGKWKANSFTFENKCITAPSNPYFFDMVAPIKKIEIEIQSSGDLITSFEGKKEKLKFIEIKESVSTAKFKTVLSAVKKYDCKVRNKKGQVFNFHFYFNDDTNQMVGTYWTPNHAYETLDVPNHTFASCEWGGDTYEGYETEYFAVYQKI